MEEQKHKIKDLKAKRIARDMEEKKFSLIICGFNEEKNLDICIKSCLNQDYLNKRYEIIYIDNNSSDNSVRIAKNYPIKVLIDEKQGLSEARNCGIRNSVGEILVFLDADLKLDKNYLKNIEQIFLDKSVGAGGGKVLPLIKTIISDYLGVSLFDGYPRYKKFKEIRTYPGCNLTIRRRVLDEVGYFMEGLKTSKGVIRFAEDKEICERIRKAGYTIIYNPHAIVHHKNRYRLLDLITVWWKGSKSRVSLINQGKNDPFSLIFRYNIPLFGFLAFIVSFFISLKISILLLVLYLILAFGLSLKIFIETRLFFQSIFVKPWMDSLSLIVINLAILYYRFRK